MDLSKNTQGNTSTALPIVFTGKKGEFFNLWIVNLLLSIITLGIYSAWAKVRTKRYFYGNTRIDGHSFRYLANPLQILKGRLIAVGFFIVYQLSASFYPPLYLLLALVLLFAMPWLLNQGLRFNLRMTSYRNVRFAFHGTYWKTFVHFFLLPLLGVLSLYLAMPWVIKRIDQYVHKNIAYGHQRLNVNTDTETYYLAVLATLGAALVIGLLVSIGSGIIMATALLNPEKLTLGPEFAPGFTLVSIIFSVLSFWLLLSVVSAIYTTMIRNHLFERSSFEKVAAFRSNMKIFAFGWISFSNALLVIVTLGLATPVAAIRRARYLAEITTVLPEAPLSEIVDDPQQASVYGEETAEVFDIDFELG